MGKRRRKMFRKYVVRKASQGMYSLTGFFVFRVMYMVVFYSRLTGHKVPTSKLEECEAV